MTTYLNGASLRWALLVSAAALAIVGLQLTASAQTAPGTVEVIDLEDTEGDGLAIYGNDMYVTIPADRGIHRIDLASFDIAETFAGPLYSTGGRGHLAIDPDGEYAYTIGASVTKVDLATGQVVDEILEGTDFHQIASPMISPDGAYLYVGQTQNIGTRIARIDLSTFSEDDVTFLDTERSQPAWSVMDAEGEYGYYGVSRGISDGEVLKVDLENMTVEDSVEGVGRGQTMVIGMHAGKIYAIDSINDMLVEIDIDTFSITGEVEFDAQPDSGTVHGEEGVIYVTGGDEPPHVYQVDIDTLSINGGISLTEDLEQPNGVTMGPDGEYLYFLTATWPDPGHVVRMKAGTMFVDFDDVPDDHLFKTEIDWMALNDITRGCNPPDNTEFCPEQTVTRGQMAAFLHRALPDLATGEATDFTDDDGSVFESDIEWLASAGVTRGCNPPDNTEFCPDDPVTRGQMAAFLVRALNLPGGDASFDDTNDHVFEDDVSALASAGVTRGCNPPANDRFCPDDPVTRGAMAAFLYRALDG